MENKHDTEERNNLLFYSLSREEILSVLYIFKFFLHTHLPQDQYREYKTLIDKFSQHTDNWVRKGDIVVTKEEVLSSLFIPTPFNPNDLTKFQVDNYLVCPDNPNSQRLSLHDTKTGVRCQMYVKDLLRYDRLGQFLNSKVTELKDIAKNLVNNKEYRNEFN